MHKPFLLRPSGKDYLWGGQRLNTEFGKDIHMNPLAETWECSTHPDGPSFVVSGEFSGRNMAELIKEHPEFLGSRHESKEELPILIKLIDAKRDLSVQVHPNDLYAKEYENGQLGKTELWYVLDAEKDAKLVYGLQKSCSILEIRDAIQNGDIEKYLQLVPVKRDDIFYLEPGTIHAIGAGCLIAEIQESSNLTYRLYDYERTGRDGKKRELHVEKALAVANLSCSAEPRQPMRVLKYQPGCAGELLCRCKYFEVHRLLVNTERRQEVHYRTGSLSYRVLLCISGCGNLCFENENLQFSKGKCIFIPADSADITIQGQAQFLDVRG